MSVEWFDLAQRLYAAETGRPVARLAHTTFTPSASALAVRASARGGSVSVSAAAFGGGEETACDEAGLACWHGWAARWRRMPRRCCSPTTAARFRRWWGWRGRTLTTVTRTSPVAPRWWGGGRIGRIIRHVGGGESSGRVQCPLRARSGAGSAAVGEGVADVVSDRGRECRRDARMGACDRQWPVAAAARCDRRRRRVFVFSGTVRTGGRPRLVTSRQHGQRRDGSAKSL